MSRFLAAGAAAAVAVSCGNPDNQIFLVSGLIPNSFITSVGSAVSAVVDIKDSQGNTRPVSVFVLTNRADLCKSLGNRPDYFQNPPEAYVAYVLATVADRLGNFAIGATNGASASLLITAGPGNPVRVYGGVGGQVSVREFNQNPGGEGVGTFDVIFADGSDVAEYFGRFKTQTCTALKQVQF